MSTPAEPATRSDGTRLSTFGADLGTTDRLQLARASLDLLRTRFGAVVASLGIADYGTDHLLVLTDAAVGDDQLPSFVAFPLATRMLLAEALGSSDVRTMSAEEYTASYPTVASVVRRPDVAYLVSVGFQRGGVTGSVSLGLPAQPDLRTDGDLQATAALIGDAFARWEQANRRNRQATDLHRSLAPGDRSVRVDVMRRAVHLPTPSGDAIGGDWYDVFDLPDGRLVAVVGDVAGRGADAVVAMAQVSAALRALLVCDHPPHRAVDELDRFAAVTRDAEGSTCVVAVIDVAAGTVELCHAGHPPAIGLSGGVASTVSSAPGPLIGFPTAPRASTTMPFAAGDTLVLYSDGLVRAATGERTSEHLAAVVARIPDGPPGMLVAELLDRWTTRPDGERNTADDDVVVVALHRPTGDGRCFSATEDATPAAITRLRHALSGWLVSQGCDAVVADVQLAVSELLANVVEHAYRAQGTGRMMVEARLVADTRGAGPAGAGGQALEVAVIDDGTWSTQIVDTVRGRGLGIVEQLTASRTIHSAGQGTIVRITFALPT